MIEINVIIPLYNKGRYIARALDSVFSQTFQNFEVMVVDDGSTDDGPEIVKRYNDRRLKLIHQENAGPGAARNRGIRESSAPLLTFLDADDEWMPEFLNESICLLRNHPDCDVIASSFYIGDKKVDRWDELRKHGIVEGLWKMSEIISKDELGFALGVLHSCATIYKRGVVLHYNGFYMNDHCSYGEDVYLWIQILLNHNIFRNPRVLAWYHIESSDLGIGSRKSIYPLEPVFTDTDIIRKNCPVQYTHILEQWLAIHSLRAAFLHVTDRNIEAAEYLIHTFPQMKEYFGRYLKLRIKMLLQKIGF